MNEFGPVEIPNDWKPAIPLEDPDWDATILRFPDASIFHSSSWARTLVEAYGHRPVYLVWPGRDGIAGVLPLMETQSPLGRRMGVSLPFSDSCPPLIDGNTTLKFPTMVEGALHHGRRADWKTAEFRACGATLFQESSVSYYTHQLDLSPGSEHLYSACSPAVRRAVRRAQSAGVVVDFHSGLQAIEEYYQLHCLVRRGHGLPPQPWRFFAALARNVIDGTAGFVARARLGSRTVAAAVFLTFGNRASYKFGASDFAVQQFRPNNLVIWEAVRRLVDDGRHTLDFGRTSLFNQGLRRFKLGWGTTESLLHYYRIRIRDKAIIPIQDRSLGWHTCLFRLVPVALSKIVGRLLYRFQV